MKDLTIVIPTYNRYNEIYGHIIYLNTFFQGTKVIVIDGTPKEKQRTFDTSLFPNISIDYICINKGITERIKIGASKVKTKYACLIGDDDRLMNEGVNLSIDCLEEHSEFIASYGQTFGWASQEKCFQMYNYSCGPRPFDKISRVIRSMHFYTPQLYCSIWRSSEFKKVVNIAAASVWSSGQVFELLVILAGNLYGNHFCIEAPYWERSIKNNTVTEGIDRITSISSWMDRHPNELDIAKNTLKKYFEQDKELIELAFLEYAFFEENRKLLASSGAMEHKYIATSKNAFPESKTLSK
jgi:glycosyltransferase domain-containing protein